MGRPDGRGAGELRPVRIERRVNRYAEGSVLVSFGNTRVLCTASIEEKVPPFLRGKGEGWVTAEYAMLPRATQTRSSRETSGVRGRSHEIQRLIGRSLRAGVALPLLGERTVWVDCDVLQADGGTRTAAITGAFVALFDAFRFLRAEGRIPYLPVKDFIAAVSVGKVGGDIRLDLEYVEDSVADVDCNVVMGGSGNMVELQGTAENALFSRGEFDRFLDLAETGIAQLVAMQKAALGVQAAEEEEMRHVAGRLCEREQA